MILAAVTQADVVAWLCFGIGTAVLTVGVALGTARSLRHAPAKTEEASAKLDEARARLDAATVHIAASTSAVATADLESFDASAADASTAAQAAGASVEEAKSALEQAQSIIAALPENLRFAGLLILVGAILMGVATVEFGGVSLF